MKCSVCGKDNLYGTIYKDKKICSYCLHEGYDFDGEGNIVKKGATNGEEESKERRSYNK